MIQKTISVIKNYETFNQSSGPASEVKGSDIIERYSFSVKIGNIPVEDIILVEDFGILISVIKQTNKNNLLTKLRPGSIGLERIILKKKFSANSIFSDWMESVVNGEEHFRKKIVITLLGHSNESEELYIIHKWRLYGCFPVSWILSPLSIYNTNIPSELLTVACEQLQEDSRL